MNRKLIPLIFIGLLIIGIGCLNDIPIEEEMEHELVMNIEGEGILEPAEGTHNYTIGEEVTIKAEAEEDWEFVEWAGDYEGTDIETTITMNDSKNITAYFEEVEEDENDEDDEEIDVGEPGETVIAFLEKMYDGNIEETAEYLVKEEAEQFEQELEEMSEEELQQIKMMMEEVDVETTIKSEEITNGEATVEAELIVSATDPMTGEEVEETELASFILLEENGEWKISEEAAAGF